MNKWTYKKDLKINSIFSSIQGEGFHSGKAATFIRFSDCNLRCSYCDTEFLSGKIMTVEQIITKIQKYKTKFIVITGGEPGLYNLIQLTATLKLKGYYIAVETNGLKPLKGVFDWVCVSPKDGYIDQIQILTMDEVKYVIGQGQKLPNTNWINACDHYWISPMGHTSGEKIGTKACTYLNNRTISYCIEMVKNNPKWKLNIQMHKVIGVE